MEDMERNKVEEKIKHQICNNQSYQCLQELSSHPTRQVLTRMLNRKLLQLGQGPILPHILGAQSANLLIQMVPEDGGKAVHETLRLRQTQLVLPDATPLEIVLEPIHAGVDLLVLLQQVQIQIAGGCIIDIIVVMMTRDTNGELGHLLGQEREEHLLFDGVMRG